MRRCFISTLLALFLALPASPRDASRTNSPAGKPLWPGKQADGSTLLPNLWSLRPAGTQVDLGDFPVNIALHPDGKFAAILHSGWGQHEIIVVDVPAARAVSHTKVDEAFYGLEFSRGGNRLYCSGSGYEVIRVYDFKEGSLTNYEEIHLRDPKIRSVPAGLAVSSDAQNLWVANVWGQHVAKVDLLARTNVLEIPFGPVPDNKIVLKPGVPASDDPDVASITKRAAAALDPTSEDAPFPYACRLDERRQRLYVSLWAQAVVAVIDLKSNKVIAHWPTEEHPNEMLLTKSGKYLYVANANRNTVTVFDADKGQAIETLYAALYPGDLPGSTPTSLALTPDEKTLFVANACNNDVAVFDVSTRGKSRSSGFIPVGWYPTSVRVTPDGKRLLVANGKGIISHPNPNGPNPGRKKAPGTIEEHIAGLMKGTLSIIDLPKGDKFKTMMETNTAIAYRCSPLKKDSAVVLARPPGNPIPGKLGESGPIKYVIYIVKENRTYDQVLGDMPEGNGEPKLCIFPERVTPNNHRIARDFVLLDNFYVEAEVSADGHEWSMGAYATDFVEKFWPLHYGHGKTKKWPFPAEGNFPVAAPAGGYLWDRANQAGVSYRSYGEFVFNGKTFNDPVVPSVKSLRGHIDERYIGFDVAYSDLKRCDRFIKEYRRFESEGDMPRLQIIRLPNDHTAGSSTGALTPTAYVAENDYATGQIVEAVSKSKFWPQTAIFIVEDDAQNGPDHVDAHRTTAYVISPYTRRHYVDSTMYSTTSMLRTMELILGLKPMTQFDAAAPPMFNSFQETPDLTPYTVLPPNVNLNERNTKLAWGADKAKKMDFTKEDAADDLLLNEMIWRSVRGPHSRMPAPTHAAFVFAHPKDDDD